MPWNNNKPQVVGKFHCSRCKTPLLKNNASPAALLEGHQHYCRVCNAKRAKRYYHENPNVREYRLKYNRLPRSKDYFHKYWEKHKDERQNARREAAKKRYWADPEAARAKLRAQYAKRKAAAS